MNKMYILFVIVSDNKYKKIEKEEWFKKMINKHIEDVSSLRSVFLSFTNHLNSTRAVVENNNVNWKNLFSKYEKVVFIHKDSNIYNWIDYFKEKGFYTAIDFNFSTTFYHNYVAKSRLENRIYLLNNGELIESFDNFVDEVYSYENEQASLEFEKFAAEKEEESKSLLKAKDLKRFFLLV